MNLRQPLDEQRGATLAEVLIALLICGVVALSLSQILQDSIKMNKYVQMKRTLHGITDEARVVLLNEDDWNKTLELNTDLACLNTRTCTNGLSGDLTLYNFGSNIVVDDVVANPTSGYDLNGTKCNTFNSTTGNDRCPFQIHLRWQVICSNVCRNPLIKVTADVAVNMATKAMLPIRANNFDFEILRENKVGTIECTGVSVRYGPSNPSTSQMNFTNTPTVTSFNDVAIVDPFTGGADQWGFTCGNEYSVMACAYDNDSAMVGNNSHVIVQNGCYKNGIGAWDPTVTHEITGTCCYSY